MRHLKLILFLVLAGLLFGAIDSATDRKAAQLVSFAPAPPLPDATIDSVDRAAVVGYYVPAAPSPAPPETPPTANGFWFLY